MKFEVKTDLSKRDFLTFYHLTEKLHFHNRYLANRIGTIAAVTLAVLLTAAVVTGHMWENKKVMIPYCIYMVLLIALPFANRFMVDRMYKASSAYLKAEYCFGDSGVRTGRDRVYLYTAFCDFCRSAGTFYLYIDPGHAMILPEGSFAEGDPAAFGAFITEKTGLTLKEIK
jgi:hypothetical protein